MSAKIQNGNLIITIPMLAEPRPSSTGKSIVVATTGGVCHDHGAGQGQVGPDRAQRGNQVGRVAPRALRRARPAEKE